MKNKLTTTKKNNQTKKNTSTNISGLPWLHHQVYSKDKGRDMKDSGKMNERNPLRFSYPSLVNWGRITVQHIHVLFPPLLLQVCSPWGLTVSSTNSNVKAFFSLSLKQALHFLYFGIGEAWGAANLCRILFSLKGSNRALAFLWNRTLRSKRTHGSEQICWLVYLQPGVWATGFNASKSSKHS